MSLALQAKLLRAIEFKSIIPIGGLEPVPIDVRIITSTHHNLKDEIKQGRFREDLYYRINVFEIEVPSLSERREDIPLLVKHVIHKFSKEMAKPVHGIHEEALQALMDHTWRGELRELENIIERAIIFCEQDIIQLIDLPEYIRTTKNHHFVLDYSKGLSEAVHDFERHFILAKLKSHHGHKSNAYKALRISKSSFYRKLQELGLNESAVDNNHSGAKKQSAKE